MSTDVVIRGGTVVDGTGAPPRRVPTWRSTTGASPRIGTDLHGELELDADGCVVAPGFIDIHTHYDAQVFWDPALRPSSSRVSRPSSPATAGSPSRPPAPSTTT